MRVAEGDSRSGVAGSTSERVTLVGIDPGLVRTGYAVVWATRTGVGLREAGVIRLEAKQGLSKRLAELAEGISTLLATHRPHTVACEALYAHYSHPRTAILMGHARGVILAAAAASGVEVLSVSATQVKKTLTGFGRAGKSQMQRAVSMALGLPGILEPNDVADAAAIALCGLSALRVAFGKQAVDVRTTGRVSRRPTGAVEQVRTTGPEAVS